MNIHCATVQRYLYSAVMVMQDATVTMAYGRRYGLVGRNGTGKTTLLRAMAHHQIKGIPENCQILHVEQEVSSCDCQLMLSDCQLLIKVWQESVGEQDARKSCILQVAGDDTTVIQAVLACDIERSQLLKEEQALLRQLNKEAPDGAHPSQSTTADGQPATANGNSATANGHPATAGDKAGLPNGSSATAAETRDNDGAVGGKEMASKAADAAESKAAAQLAQVPISCISTSCNSCIAPYWVLGVILHSCIMPDIHAESNVRVTALFHTCEWKERIKGPTHSVDNLSASPALNHSKHSFPSSYPGMYEQLVLWGHVLVCPLITLEQESFACNTGRQAPIRMQFGSCPQQVLEGQH